MTGTDLCVNKPHLVPVIFEPPCTYIVLIYNFRAEIAPSVKQLATSWTVRGSNPGVGEIFRTRPDRSCGPPSLLHNGYCIFPVVNRPKRGSDHTPHLAPRLKKEQSYTSTPRLGLLGLF